MDREDTLFIGWNTTFDIFKLLQTRAHIDNTVQPFKCKVLDLYLHAALKGPLAAHAFSGRSKYSAKKVAAIRKVPLAAAPYVEEAVSKRLQPLMPAGSTISYSHHEVKDRKDLVSLSWSCDVTLSLKAHAKLWGEETIKLADVWPLPPKDTEKLWLGSYLDAKGEVIEPYKGMQAATDAIVADDSSPFYEYARKDIEYLKLAYEKLGHPEPDHHDTATHVVAFTRWYGFPVDREVIERTKRYYSSEMVRLETLLAGTDLKSPVQRKALLQRYDPLIQSTKKTVLEAISKMPDHPACATATAMLKYGSTKQRLDQTIKAGEPLDGRIHPDLRVLGTATGRMSGTGGFNIQGCGKVEKDADGQKVGLRQAVQAVAVGDFAAFEVAIAASAWNDPKLLADLDAGVDVHLATAIACHPLLVYPLLVSTDGRAAYTYEQAVELKAAKDPLITKCRDHCKRMVFGILYGCTAQKIMEVFNVEEEVANQILQRFYLLYPGLAAFKRGVEARFCTADTDGWDKASVESMADSETDLTGFTRRWCFEKEVATIMWELGNKGLRMPVTGNVVRQVQKGSQPIAQAVRSAFLGAAIAIQQACYRQAANMKIQASGANLCKDLQATVWERHRVPVLNVHDELVFPAHPNMDYPAVKQTVNQWVLAHRSLVKHLAFDLNETERWSDK